MSGSICRPATEGNIRQTQKLSQRLAQESSVLAEIGRVISSSLNIEEVYEKFAQAVKKLIPIDRIVITLLDRATETIRFSYLWGVNVEGRRLGDVFPLRGTITEKFLAHPAGLVIDMEKENGISYLKLPAQADLRSAVSVPLIFRNEVVGSLHFQSKMPKAYHDRDVCFGERIAAQISGAIANARLFAECKKAEEELRKSHKLLQGTFASLLDGIFIIGEETLKIVDCNPAATRIFGYSREEMVGQTPSFLHKDETSRKEFRNAVDRGIKEHGFFHCPEFQMKRKNGTIFPTEHSVVPLESEQGRRIGWVSLVRDITQRKRTMEALEESERTARRLAKEKAILAIISKIITSTPNIEEVYNQFAGEVMKLVPIDRIVVNLILPEEDCFKITYVYGQEVEKSTVGTRVPLAGSLTAKVARTGTGMLVALEDIEQTRLQSHHLMANFEAGLRSILSVPLISRNTAIGALHLQSKKPQAYTDEDLRLAGAIADQISGALANSRLFAEREQALETLKKREEELEENSKSLEEVNAALRVLLDYREKDKRELEEGVLTNVRDVLLPYVEKLRRTQLTPDGEKYLKFLEENLGEIISPFVRGLKAKYLDLTPKETQIAHLIKSGKTTKEIAAILNLSPRTVDFHRESLRKKLGLKNKGASLFSFLSSF